MVAVFVGLIEFCLREVLLVDQVVEKLSERGESFRIFFNMAVEDAIDDFIKIIKHYFKRLIVLFFENGLVFSIDFSLPIQFVEVEAIRVGTVVST